MTRASRRGTGAVALLLAAGTVALFIAVVSSWARREALDTSQFGRTSRQALTDPKVREALALSVVDAVYRRVDVQGEIRRVLPPAVSNAAAPAASAIRLYGPRAIEELIKVPFVLSALVQASELLQRWALEVVDGDPAPERNAYLAARPLLLLAAAQAGVERDVATALPADPANLPLYRRIGALRPEISLLKSVSDAAMPIALALYSVALGLAAGRRRQTVVWIGLSAAVAGVALMALRSLVGPFVVDAVAGSRPELEPAGADVWRIVTAPLTSTGTIVLVTGLVAAAFAVLTGPSRAAEGARAALAPVLAPRPLIAWAAAGVGVVIALVEVPAVDRTGRLLAGALVLVILAGTESLQRSLRDEHDAAPHVPAPRGPVPARRTSDLAATS